MYTLLTLAIIASVYHIFIEDTGSGKAHSSESNNEAASVDLPASKPVTADVPVAETALDIPQQEVSANCTPAEDRSAEIQALRGSIDDADQQLSSWKYELEAWHSKIDQMKSDIQTLKSEKQGIERAAEVGETVNEQRYEAIIAEANDLVHNYNSLRNQHNALVRKYNALIHDRNAKLKRLKALEEEQ